MASTELCPPPRTAQELFLEFKATGRQEPFEEIVRRYAGMVYHVCLRVTRNNHDAEDATQAVFLTLAVQARQDKEIRYIGPWLQQVAHRLSLDLRKSKKRRERREERHGQDSGGEHVESDVAQQLHFDEMKSVINQEINKLPPKYRVPLIMHYFGGLSREEMARELQCKPGTLGVRQHRAREMLGQRLARRGVAMAEGTMSLAVAYAVQSLVAEHIIANTCQAASNIVVGNAATSHLVPAQLVAMARGAVHSVLLAKVKTVAALLVAMGCAMAAGAEVVSKVTPLDLGLDLQLRIGEWVKDHLMPFSSIQARAEREEEAGERAFATADSTSEHGFGHGIIVLEGRPFDVPSPAVIPLAPEAPGIIVGGTAGGRHADFGPRVPMRMTSGIASDAAPRSGLSHWDTFAAAPGAPARAIAPRAYGDPSPRLSAPAPMVSAVPVVRQRERSGESPPRSASPLPPRPWRPQLPTLPDRGGIDSDDEPEHRNPTGGGNDRPGKPRKPGGNSTVDDKTRQPVQVASADSGSVNIYLPPTSPAPRVPRSPAAISITAADAPLATGNETAVNFESVSGVVFQVGASTFSNAVKGSVLQSASDFSGTEWNVVPSLEVFSAGDAVDADSSYTDRTLFRLDVETQRLVVLGRQSRAKVTGVTVESAPGRLGGWGTVGPADSFDQSGQVIADGLGQPRILNLSQIRVIRNLTENTGANGWYARNGGKVILPEMRILPGTREYTWGEEPSDAQLDLVNSVRLRIRDALTPGTLRLALTAHDRGEVPPLPGGHQFVGLWQIDAAGLRANGADLTVRYDDGLIADLGFDESSVMLWAYGGAGWKQVREGFALDPDNNIVSGSIDSATFFAVAVTPEPGLLGITVGASPLLLRRRRR